MKCHEFCQALFDERFLPLLQERFPQILPKLSIGVVGAGSEVLGADDELSRDHSWGPGSCRFFVPEGVTQAQREDLAQELSNAVPESFLQVSYRRPDAIEVTTIDDFYRSCDYVLPTTIKEWANHERCLQDDPRDIRRS